MHPVRDIRTYSEPRNRALIHSIVTTPMRSPVKYQLDRESGALIVERILHSAISFPINYGVVPQTTTASGFPLEAAVLSSDSVVPGAVQVARVIGVMDIHVPDSDHPDMEVVLATHVRGYLYSYLEDVDQLPRHVRRVISAFFGFYAADGDLDSRAEVSFRNHSEGVALVREAVERFDASSNNLE